MLTKPDENTYNKYAESCGFLFIYKIKPMNIIPLLSTPLSVFYLLENYKFGEIP